MNASSVEERSIDEMITRTREIIMKMILKIESLMLDGAFVDVILTDADGEGCEGTKLAQGLRIHGNGWFSSGMGWVLGSVGRQNLNWNKVKCG